MDLSFQHPLCVRYATPSSLEYRAVLVRISYPYCLALHLLFPAKGNLIRRTLGRLVLSASSLLAAHTSASQIRFESSLYDMGTVHETDSLVDVSFSFENRSGIGIEIERVEGDCGCADITWTQGEIPSGSVGGIYLHYLVHNRPGSVERYLNVFFAGEPIDYRLKITGVVTPIRHPGSFPYSFGPLRTLSKAYHLGSVSAEDAVARSFEVYNPGSSAVSLSQAIAEASDISLRLIPDTIQAREVGELEITYDPGPYETLGYVTRSQMVHLRQDTLEFRSLLRFSAVIEQADDSYSSKASLRLSRAEIDFGEVRPGKSYESKVFLHSRGDSDVAIRKVQTNCSCVEAGLQESSISAGMSEKLVIRVSPIDRVGRYRGMIWLFSNDKKKPVRAIQLDWQVK